MNDNSNTEIEKDINEKLLHLYETSNKFNFNVGDFNFCDVNISVLFENILKAFSNMSKDLRKKVDELYKPIFNVVKNTKINSNTEDIEAIKSVNNLVAKCYSPQKKYKVDEESSLFKIIENDKGLHDSNTNLILKEENSEQTINCLKSKISSNKIFNSVRKEKRENKIDEENNKRIMFKSFIVKKNTDNSEKKIRNCSQKFNIFNVKKKKIEKLITKKMTKSFFKISNILKQEILKNIQNFTKCLFIKNLTSKELSFMNLSDYVSYGIYKTIVSTENNGFEIEIKIEKKQLLKSLSFSISKYFKYDMLYNRVIFDELKFLNKNILKNNTVLNNESQIDLNLVSFNDCDSEKILTQIETKSNLVCDIIYNKDDKFYDDFIIIFKDNIKKTFDLFNNKFDYEIETFKRKIINSDSITIQEKDDLNKFLNMKKQFNSEFYIEFYSALEKEFILNKKDYLRKFYFYFEKLIYKNQNHLPFSIVYFILKKNFHKINLDCLLEIFQIEETLLTRYYKIFDKIFYEHFKFELSNCS